MATPIPSNRARFTREEVLRATGAIGGRSDIAEGHSTPCVGVTTDSRGDISGKLFVALTGEHFDGHRFVADVLGRGAWGAIVERPVKVDDSSRLFLVTSTLDALGALARSHRQRWGGKVVTIGGSAGKTTTRSACCALLDAIRPGEIHGTVGNLNNLIGVPMTLLGLDSQHTVAVVEVGTNQTGEVERLAAICLADVAVLTCIGIEHAEGLGDLDGIEAEEGALFTSLRAGAHVIGQLDDARVLRQLSRFAPDRVRSYGTEPRATYQIAERRVIDAQRTEARILRKLGALDRAQPGEPIEEIRTITRLFGLPGVLASTAAIAVADALWGPVEPRLLEAALDREVGEQGRLRIIERSDRAVIINDCYNANPVSMRSSIAVAKELAAARRSRLSLVIGDMLELGAFSRREHEALADELTGVASVVAIGDEMQALVERARHLGLATSTTHFVAADAATGCVAQQLQAGDVVLVKGSRGMKLERIVDALTEKRGLVP